MTNVTETFPGTIAQSASKQDVQTAPVGSEDKWCRAADLNDLASFKMSLGRAIRYLAPDAVYNSDAADISGKVVAILDTLQGVVKKCRLAKQTDLNAEYRLAIATLGPQGSTTTFAGSTFGFASPYGVVHALSGFATGALYTLATSGGLLVTYAGGERPPVAIGLNATSVLFFGRAGPRLDNSTLNYDANGKVQVPTSANLIVDTFAAGALPGSSDVGVKKSRDAILGMVCENTATSANAAAAVRARSGSLQALMQGFHSAYTLSFWRYKSFHGAGSGSGSIFGNTVAGKTVEFIQGGATAGNVVFDLLSSAFRFKKDVRFSTVTAPDANVATFTMNLPDGLSMGDVSMCWLRTFDAIRGKTTYQLTALVK